ncbi:hypothetical protein D3C71_1251600 [compost metagenome]
MALHALHGQRGREAAAAAHAQQITEHRGGGRLTGDAPVDGLAAFAEDAGHATHTVDGIAFLVTGQQHRQRAGMIRMGGHELFGRHHEGSHTAFHIGRATPVQHAITDLRIERITGPGRDRAGRHHIGMPEQHQHRRALPVCGPQVVDLAQAQVFAVEAGTLETAGQ